jgi:hypothetical protein
MVMVVVEDDGIEGCGESGEGERVRVVVGSRALEGVHLYSLSDEPTTYGIGPNVGAL